MTYQTFPKVKKFQDLKVWEKAHFLALKMYSLTKDFPEDEKFGLVSQIRRASFSIPANLAEGYMKSNKDFRRFLDISRGSLEELKYYFILSKDLGFITEEIFTGLFEDADEIGKMLYALKMRLAETNY